MTPVLRAGSLQSRRSWWRARLLVLQVAFPIALIVAWQFAADRMGMAFFTSSPLAVLDFLATNTLSGWLLSHARVTFYEAAIGFVFGALLGIVVGLLLAVLETPRRILEPYFVALYGTPVISLAPLFVIWFGIGLGSKVAIAFLIVFMPVFYNTFQGVKNVPHELLNAVRVLGASRFDLWRKVVLPAASPWIITGLKVALPQALVGAVVGEFIASSAGIGYLVQYYAALFDMTGVLATTLLMAAVVVGLNEALNRIEARVLRWRPRIGTTVIDDARRK